MNARGISSPRLLFALVGVAIMLAIAGAVSFVRYSTRAAPDAHRVAVAPFDLFVSGLDPWRVQLARRVTDRIATAPGWSAVPQEVVAQRWKGQDRAEVAAVELARRTQAGIAIYGRVDSVSVDSVRLHALLVDVMSTVVAKTVELRTTRAEMESAAENLGAKIVDSLRALPP
jgi:hypothetical protein